MSVVVSKVQDLKFGDIVKTPTGQQVVYVGTHDLTIRTAQRPNQPYQHLREAWFVTSDKTGYGRPFAATIAGPWEVIDRVPDEDLDKLL